MLLFEGHRLFSALCERLESFCCNLDDKGLVCSLMYLLKMGIKQSSDVVNSLLMECQQRYRNMEPSVLSRYMNRKYVFKHACNNFQLVFEEVLLQDRKMLNLVVFKLCFVSERLLELFVILTRPVKLSHSAEF